MKRYIPNFDDFEIHEDDSKQLLVTEFTDDQEKAIEDFVNIYIAEDKPFDKFLPEFQKSLNEGLFGRLDVGLAGLAVGKGVGKLLAKILGIQQGSLLYKVITSRKVAVTLGSAIAKKRL